MQRTISFVRGKGDLLHNNRQRKKLPRNVDPARVKDNYILIQEDIETAYNNAFGKAIEDYNKGKRPCRQKTVRDYMAQIEANQNKPNQPRLYYEWVIQVGDMMDSGHDTNRNGFRACGDILKEYLQDFRRRNPGIYVFNAVIHMDEKTPHIHLDGFFVGRGFKNGMQTRNSQTKAFENMGFKTAGNKEDNGLKAWQQREREELSRIALKHGIETALQNAGPRKQLSVNEYKTLMQYADREAERTADRVLDERGTLDKLAGRVNEKDYKRILLAYRGKCNELERERHDREEEREKLLSMDAVRDGQNAEQLRGELEQARETIRKTKRDFYLLSDALHKVSAYVPLQYREKMYQITNGVKGANLARPSGFGHKKTVLENQNGKEL